MEANGEVVETEPDKLSHIAGAIQRLASPVLHTEAIAKRTEAKVNAIVRHELGQSYPLLAMLAALLLVGLGTFTVLVLILLRLPNP